MRSRSYSSEGIVLARRSFGEGDRIISVYTKNQGRVSLIAKGVRKPKSRKRGHVEVFNKIIFHGVSGKGIDIMTEVEVVDDYGEFRKNLKKVSLAYYFMEVLGKTTHENESNKKLYDILSDYLNDLKSSKKLKDLRLSFVKEVLVASGFWPEGVDIFDPDKKLEEVIERQVVSSRVGKRMLE